MYLERNKNQKENIFKNLTSRAHLPQVKCLKSQVK